MLRSASKGSDSPAMRRHVRAGPRSPLRDECVGRRPSCSVALAVDAVVGYSRSFFFGALRTWAFSPCLPIRLRNSTGLDRVAPNQCGVRVSNSATSPGSRTRSCSPRTRRQRRTSSSRGGFDDRCEHPARLDDAVWDVVTADELSRTFTNRTGQASGSVTSSAQLAARTRHKRTLGDLAPAARRCGLLLRTAVMAVVGQGHLDQSRWWLRGRNPT